MIAGSTAVRRERHAMKDGLAGSTTVRRGAIRVRSVVVVA